VWDRIQGEFRVPERRRAAFHKKKRVSVLRKGDQLEGEHHRHTGRRGSGFKGTGNPTAAQVGIWKKRDKGETGQSEMGQQLEEGKRTLRFVRQESDKRRRRT